ncbi:hypothetical protein NLK61_03995 [Pseudomonas fuscovaginae UPB0736]|uniref:hypothetical protein n=1 Tax=Pseudomonas asplenii TaxID=53407 RepID=UPI0012BCFC25|nr:hypothetical protein [Pseudomonas fuscovaginae]UUQ65821.1 hypothetical protein NLK61_03995 [Pseudomonas fuscovaginae UPB0736]
MDKTFISVTTDLEVAKYLSRDGMVYSGYVPKSSLIEQILSGAGEKEYLLTHGTDLLKPITEAGR